MLILRRYKLTKSAILGRLEYNGKVVCSTLENRLRSIPVGTYKLEYSHSPKFHTNMLRLVGVPHRTGILIHAGNKPSDTMGCILVGEPHPVHDYIVNSQITLKHIVPFLRFINQIQICENYD